MGSSAATKYDVTVPLCVDLDGTLIRTDMLWESLVRLLKRNPLHLFSVLFWWTRGRAFLKARIAERVQVDPATLPFSESFLEYLRAEKARGRRLLLVTASDAAVAQAIAKHMPIFDDVLASDGARNLRGRNKGETLARLFGRKGFDYAGNSRVDLPVWEQAREAVVVNGHMNLEARAARCTTLGPVFKSDTHFSTWLRLIRPHQWLKNLIIFVPLLTSHQIAQVGAMTDALLAFVAFSLCASGVYVFNDLMDLDSDRHHPTKRQRPLASGTVPIQGGLFLFPVLLGFGFAVGVLLTWQFVMVLGIYLALTIGYSWQLKQIAVLDVLCLAGLYTVRLAGGHEATQIAYSFWLLVFSMFIFLSLALLKRYVELATARQLKRIEIKGRGYAAEDAAVVAMLGIGNGLMAVLVLALYVNSQEVTRLYHHPMVLLLICPFLLYWISRVWLLAHRGRMHEDPIVFALKDIPSYAVGLLTLIILWLATAQ
jgi:4-hydroxybenzoate polyprenyltransferase/phosphoserine phosphatase